MYPSSFKRRATFLLVGAVFLLLPLSLSARQKEDERAILVGETAFLLGTPRVVVPASVFAHTISPDGRYLLAFHQYPAPVEPFSRMRESLTLPTKHSLTLTLFDARTGRSRALKTWNDNETVFRFPDEITWFADGDTVVVALFATHLPPGGVLPKSQSEFKLSMDAELLLIHCARQTVQTTALLAAQPSRPFVSISPSPTRAEALINYSDVTTSDKQMLSLLSASGSLNPVLTDRAEYVSVYGWSQDGNDMLLETSQFTANQPTVRTWWIWDRRTKMIHQQAERPKDRKFGGNSPRYKGTTSPIRLVTETGTLKTERGATRSTSCVVAEGEDSKDHVVLTADGEAVGVLGKPESPTLIYQQNAVLYAVSVRGVTKVAYLAYLQKQVADHAEQIGTGLRQYAQDYDDQYPPTQGSVSELVLPYLSDDRYPLRDPRTGEDAFTYTYTGIPDANGRTALFTLKTTVGTYRVWTTKSGELVTERGPPRP